MRVRQFRVKRVKLVRKRRVERAQLKLPYKRQPVVKFYERIVRLVREVDAQRVFAPARRRLYFDPFKHGRHVYAPLVAVKKKVYPIHKQPKRPQKPLLKQRRRHYRLVQRFALHLYFALPKVRRTFAQKVVPLHKSDGLWQYLRQPPPYPPHRAGRPPVRPLLKRQFQFVAPTHTTLPLPKVPPPIHLLKRKLV